jgi:hypothetical protein
MSWAKSSFSRTMIGDSLTCVVATRGPRAILNPGDRCCPGHAVDGGGVIMACRRNRAGLCPKSDRRGPLLQVRAAARASCVSRAWFGTIGPYEKHSVASISIADLFDRGVPRAGVRAAVSSLLRRSACTPETAAGQGVCAGAPRVWRSGLMPDSRSEIDSLKFTAA